MVAAKAESPGRLFAGVVAGRDRQAPLSRTGGSPFLLTFPTPVAIQSAQAGSRATEKSPHHSWAVERLLATVLLCGACPSWGRLGTAVRRGIDVARMFSWRKRCLDLLIWGLL